MAGTDVPSTSTSSSWAPGRAAVTARTTPRRMWITRCSGRVSRRRYDAATMGEGDRTELLDVDVWGTEQGYVIPKDKYYLPEIEFEPGELVALLVAVQSGGPDPAAESGARKLLYGADGGVLAGLGGGPLASGSDARSNLVHAAAEAAQELRRVRFAYRTSQGKTGDRDVDAWAMVFRAGHWYLVGHDRERDDVRAFRDRRVRFAYRTSQGKTGDRDVDAWAMVFRAGHWYLVGHDRERDDVRAF